MFSRWPTGLPKSNAAEVARCRFEPAGERFAAQCRHRPIFSRSRGRGQRHGGVRGRLTHQSLGLYPHDRRVAAVGRLLRETAWGKPGPGVLAYPFTVNQVGVGYASASRQDEARLPGGDLAAPVGAALLSFGTEGLIFRGQGPGRHGGRPRMAWISPGRWPPWGSTGASPPFNGSDFRTGSGKTILPFPRADSGCTISPRQNYWQPLTAG